VTGAVVLGTSGRPVFATAFLHVLFVPCQGSFNALIYHGYADALAEAISNFVNKNNFWTRRKHHGFAASSSSPSSCSSLRAAAASAAATARSLFFAPNNGNNRNEGTSVTSDGNVVGDSDLSGSGGLLVTPRTEVGAADSASFGKKEADTSAVSAVAGGQKHHLAALMKLQTEALVSGGWGCARLSNTGSSSSSKNQTENEMKGDGAVEGTTNNASGGDSNNGSIGGGGGGGTRTLFVTTYNLGEALLDNQNDDSNNVNGEGSGGTSGGGSGVSTWVPLGYDVYAIGVQECMDLPSLRAKIAAHLNSSSSSSSSNDASGSGSASGEGYVMYTREMGSTVTGLGFHGMIALTIFVRSSDVNSGAVKVLCGAKVETATAAAPMTVAGAAGAAVAAVGEKKVAEGDKSSSSSSSLAAAAALRPIVAMGQRLPGGLRAPNKGSVGIAVNVLGSPIAFLTVSCCRC
jgi:hypothetical protein